MTTGHQQLPESFHAHTHIYIYTVYIIQLMNEWWLVGGYIWIYIISIIIIIYIVDIVNIKKPGYIDLRLCPALAPQRLIEVHRRVDPQGAIGQANHGHLSTHLGRNKSRGDRWIFQISRKINIKPIRSVCRWPYNIYIIIIIYINIFYIIIFLSSY